MPPTFYFAIGSRPARRDYEIARAVGQRHFLVPFDSAAIPWIERDDVAVVLDSRAWPPDAPARPPLDAYIAALLGWRRAEGDWGPLDWAAAYDHIGNPGQTQADYYALLGALAAAGAEDCPIVPVTHYPGRAVDTILIDMQLGPAGTRWDVTEWDGNPLTRPCYAVGGLVRPLSPTQPREVFNDVCLVRQSTERTGTDDDRRHRGVVDRSGLVAAAPVRGWPPRLRTALAARRQL